MIVVGSADPGIYDDPVYTISPLISSLSSIIRGVVTVELVPSLRIFWILRVESSADVTSILVILEPDCSNPRE